MLRFCYSIAILIFLSGYINVSFQQIPVSAWKEYLGMNVTAFLASLEKGENISTEDDGVDILFPTDTESASIGGSEVIAGMVAIPAEVCQPHEQGVAFPRDPDPNVVIYPECTTLMRCGGCCGHDMLECRNTSAYREVATIIKSRYSHTTGSFVYVGMFPHETWQHQTCECVCKVRAEHCHPVLQKYVESSCRCQCLNEHMSSTCTSDKIWDERQCDCVCPKLVTCASDEFFNTKTCRCEFDLMSQGVPVMGDGGSVGAVAPNPCLNTQCRIGYNSVVKDNQCKCVMSDYWGVQAASIQHEYDPAEVEPPRRTRPPTSEEPTELPTSTLPPTTTTTETTTTTRPRRPRPRQRNLRHGHRG